MRGRSRAPFLCSVVGLSVSEEEGGTRDETFQVIGEFSNDLFAAFVALREYDIWRVGLGEGEKRMRCMCQ